MVRVAVLDDYQDVALKMTDWSTLPREVEVRVFQDHLKDEDALVGRLQDFAIVMAMRERTPFPRSTFERLPNLKLLTTTGMRNAAIDMQAAMASSFVALSDRGVIYPTAELTWGLILSFVTQTGEYCHHAAHRLCNREHLQNFLRSDGGKYQSVS